MRLSQESQCLRKAANSLHIVRHLGGGYPTKYPRRHDWWRVKLLICCPIADPSTWVISADRPDGYIVLRSISIALRSAGKTPGTALVRSEPIDALQSQLQRLLAAWARCNDASRTEIVAVAERLAGAKP